MILFPSVDRRHCTPLARVGVGSLIATAVLACALPDSAALARPTHRPDRVAVHYGDLDLNRSEDAAALYIRLQRAAWTVCDSYKRDLLLLNMRLKCYENTLADAVQRVDRPMVLALHRAQPRAGYKG